MITWNWNKQQSERLHQTVDVLCLYSIKTLIVYHYEHNAQVYSNETNAKLFLLSLKFSFYMYIFTYKWLLCFEQFSYITLKVAGFKI